MSVITSLTRSRGSLGELFSGRDNGVGFIRLGLACSVVVSHSRTLGGFRGGDFGAYASRQQTALGGLAVFGFFVLSGMLITRSAGRAGILRYFWHRGLRILPGLWVCLAVTALAVAPLVAIHEHGSIGNFWHNPQQPGGPVAYITANAWTGVNQWGIQDLLLHTTYWGRHSNGSVFDGALWSLVYEMLCYIVIGGLAVTGVLRNSPRFVALMTFVLWLRILFDFRESNSWTGPIVANYWFTFLPRLGFIDFHWVVYLGFLFMLGGTFELYRDRLPIHDGLGIASVLAVALSLRYGAFYVIGFPAFAYMLIWAGVRAPRQVHWVGRKNDYSYGIYIYGFVGQQVMASIGWTRWGLPAYLALSLSVAFVAAFLSWHLVEKHALRLKHWTPKRPARWIRQAKDRWKAYRSESVETSVSDPEPLPVG